jgi:hypothetical protein
MRGGADNTRRTERRAPTRRADGLAGAARRTEADERSSDLAAAAMAAWQVGSRREPYRDAAVVAKGFVFSVSVGNKWTK